MTKEEAAAKLDGCEYREEGSKELWAAMKAAGLVAVYGASDDLCEFEGAIRDEPDLWPIRMTPKGIFQNECREGGEECPYHKRLAAGLPTIRPRWCKGDVPWTYETTIPHATFLVMEDGEPYCRGIVFALADVPTVASTASVPAAVSECLGFFASCIKSGEAWSATCEEMYAKAKAALGRAP